LAVSATVTPLFAARALEADLRRRVADLERDNETLTEMWCRANRECERQRILLRALGVFTARKVILPAWCLRTIGFLFGLAAGDLLWP
jgi:hypothetical protein